MPQDDKTPVSKIDETKPVVWTAEDASRFLTSAIHEAQKPLAEALKQRPITARALTMLIAVIVVAAFAIALILSSQLEKTEKRADRALQAREEIMTEKMVLQAQTQALEDRLNSIQSRHDELYGQVADLKMNEERHRRTISELARFKQSNDILRDYISGLEQEKASLSTKLMKALSIEPGSEADLDKLIEAAELEDAPPPAATDTPEKPDEPVETVPPGTPSDVTPIGGAIAPPVVSEPEAPAEALVEVAPEEPAPAAPEAVMEEPPAPAEEPIAEPEVTPAVAQPEPEAALEAAPEGEAVDTFQSTSEQYGEQLAKESVEPAEEPVPATEEPAAAVVEEPEIVQEPVAPESEPEAVAAVEEAAATPADEPEALGYNIDAAVEAMDKDLDDVRVQHEALVGEQAAAGDEAEAAEDIPADYPPEDEGAVEEHIEAVVETHAVVETEQPDVVEEISVTEEAEESEEELPAEEAGIEKTPSEAEEAE